MEGHAEGRSGSSVVPRSDDASLLFHHLTDTTLAGARAHYLDASVIVKLVAEDPIEEPGRVAIREYFFDLPTASFRTTSYCVAETFSVFKHKWLKGEISMEDYAKDFREFARLVNPRLTIEDAPITAKLLDEADSLMRKYELDVVDSIQLITIRQGIFAGLAGTSQSLLITADEKLAFAARSEGVWPWNCRTEDAPK